MCIFYIKLNYRFYIYIGNEFTILRLKIGSQLNMRLNVFENPQIKFRTRFAKCP